MRIAWRRGQGHSEKIRYSTMGAGKTTMGNDGDNCGRQGEPRTVCLPRQAGRGIDAPGSGGLGDGATGPGAKRLCREPRGAGTRRKRVLRPGQGRHVLVLVVVGGADLGRRRPRRCRYHHRAGARAAARGLTPGRRQRLGWQPGLLLVPASRRSCPGEMGGAGGYGAGAPMPEKRAPIPELQPPMPGKLTVEPRQAAARFAGGSIASAPKVRSVSSVSATTPR
jgi:hypothetical protein